MPLKWSRARYNTYNISPNLSATTNKKNLTFNSLYNFRIQLLILEFASWSQSRAGQCVLVPEGIHQLACQLCPSLGVTCCLIKFVRGDVHIRARNQLHILQGWLPRGALQQQQETITQLDIQMESKEVRLSSAT